MPMGAAFRVLSVGERKTDADHPGSAFQSIPDLVQRQHVAALLARRVPRHDEIGVLGHPPEPEIDLAEERAALEQGLIAESVPERPQEARQVEVLLDDLRLQALSGRRLAAEIGQERPVGKSRKRASRSHRSFSTTRHRVLTCPRRGVPGTMDVSDCVASARRRRAASFEGLIPMRSSNTPSRWQLEDRATAAARWTSLPRSTCPRAGSTNARATRVAPAMSGYGRGRTVCLSLRGGHRSRAPRAVISPVENASRGGQRRLSEQP